MKWRPQTLEEVGERAAMNYDAALSILCCGALYNE